MTEPRFTSLSGNQLGLSDIRALFSEVVGFL